MCTKYIVDVKLSNYIHRSTRFSNYSSVLDYLSNIFDKFSVEDVSIKKISGL